MIDAAKKEIRRPLTKTVKAPKRDGRWQVLVVADTHFGKYAWGKTTGGDDYDLDQAERLVGSAGRVLLAVGEAHSPTRRTIAFLGDLFHYDTPTGTTTSGTPLERDGRLQKMIAVGCDSLLAIVERSAETVPTDVVIVNGDPNPNRPDLQHYGAGETMVKPMLAAVANAVFDATGTRMRRVPFATRTSSSGRRT
jgi:hypothetical protein